MTIAHRTQMASQSDLVGTKVLIIVENETVPFDRRVWQIARALTANGANVRIISPMGKGAEARYEVLQGIHVYRHPLPSNTNGVGGYVLEYASSLFWQLFLSLRIFLRDPFHVIHACNPPDLIFLVASIFKPFGVRLVFDQHDLNPELYVAKFGRRDFIWRLLKLAERLSFWTADVTLATNESYREIAIERGKKAPEKVFVVRNGPDLSRFKLHTPNPDWKHGRKFLVVYVGTMGTQEGIELLLEAVRHITSLIRRADIHFCIVGGGPSLDTCKEEARRLNLMQFVTFTGRIDCDELLFEILSTADICVGPDRVSDYSNKSTMIKTMEYMAFAKPVVQFDMKEGRFTARDAAVYAQPNDAVHLAKLIVELADNPALRAKMGHAGQQRVETDLAWHHQVPRLLAAYVALRPRGIDN